MITETKKPYLIFISHSHVDGWVARQIAKNLEAEGIETFLDQLHIAAGEDFEARIVEALYQADELLVLFTPWGQASKFVWMEIGAAWYKKIPNEVARVFSENGNGAKLIAIESAAV